LKELKNIERDKLKSLSLRSFERNKLKDLNLRNLKEIKSEQRNVFCIQIQKILRMMKSLLLKKAL